MNWPPSIHISVLYFVMSGAQTVLFHKTAIFIVGAKYYNCLVQE